MAADLAEVQRLYEQDMQSLLELTVTNVPVRERHVRQASVIVRRWLCDNELRRFSAHLGASITFPVLDDRHVFESAASDPNVDYYLSAGVMFAGSPVWQLYHSKADDVPRWALELTAPTFKEEKLGRAMKRPVLYFNNETFNMDEVLRFACNKLGGAHFDVLRNEREGKLDAAAAYVTFGSPEGTLANGRAGTIHLPLEREGVEVLSGIAIIVIVAATMLLNIRLDGVPLLEFEEGPV